MARRLPKALLSGALSLILSVSVVLGCAGSAFADVKDSYWPTPTSATNFNYTKILKTYGVRAGAAGPDFLGITNTNFDFSAASPTSYVGLQYTNYTYAELIGVKGAGLAIWATSVNENPNPFYANLLYRSLYDAGNAVAATTWVSNPDESSWGDSTSTRSQAADGSYTINGLEYSPEIIFGANKSTNWGNNDYSSTNIYKYAANNENYNPTFTNNDSTNTWTQIYTLEQLAIAAEGVKASTGTTTRYDGNNSITGAVSYEKAIRGNLLYVASQIDQGVTKKKKVAYLYAINRGTAYFFIPEATGLTTGTDTNGGAAGLDQVSGYQNNAGFNSYAGNNATIDLDYLGVLPFITDTFTDGTPVSGGIVMKVEDIWKSNPAISVSSSNKTAMSDVDVIIYNTSVNTDLQGTSGGKNSSGINNTVALSQSVVETWAEKHGFDTAKGLIIAGSDYGTSTNQGFGTVSTTQDGMAPLLYCQRNYTADKPARAAWAFSKVYPELYPNSTASYGYWVNKVYHVKMSYVPYVVVYMTNMSLGYSDEGIADVYNSNIASAMEQCFQVGLNWWNSSGKNKSEWARFSYYNGSSRASYYDGNSASEELANKIGIFQPSSSWLGNQTDISADKTSLTAAIAKAQSSLDTTVISTDGVDVRGDLYWVTQDTYDALKEAFEKAQPIAEASYVTQRQVNDALEALNVAQDTFDKARAQGKGSGAAVDLTDLKAAVAIAAQSLASTVSSADGTDVFVKEYWVPTSVYDALKSAYDAGLTVSQASSTTKERADAALADLQTAQTAFDNARAAGTSRGSITQFMAGYCLVRYEPESPIAQGCATYKGAAMMLNETTGEWVTFVTGDVKDVIASKGKFSSVTTGRRTVISAPSVAGDINDSGSFNIVDVQVAYDVATNKYPYSTERVRLWLLSDVNADGACDAQDAQAAHYLLLRSMEE